ncbi:MAG: hypothetical protein EOO77_05400 [Oxalobacteraceae bacterium]|nr:MAG: hypothetical protein EOO77_05400 [Oxalobacteraceae bacterium]
MSKTHKTISDAKMQTCHGSSTHYLRATFPRPPGLPATLDRTGSGAHQAVPSPASMTALDRERSWTQPGHSSVFNVSTARLIKDIYATACTTGDQCIGSWGVDVGQTLEHQQAGLACTRLRIDVHRYDYCMNGYEHFY